MSTLRQEEVLPKLFLANDCLTRFLMSVSLAFHLEKHLNAKAAVANLMGRLPEMLGSRLHDN